MSAAWHDRHTVNSQGRSAACSQTSTPCLSASEAPVQAGLCTAAMPTCKARCSSTRAGSAQPVVLSRCRRAASSVGRCVLGAGLWCAVLSTLQQACNMLAWAAFPGMVHSTNHHAWRAADVGDHLPKQSGGGCRRSLVYSASLSSLGDARLTASPTTRSASACAAGMHTVHAGVSCPLYSF